jgi:hypothetical protein
VRLPGFIGPSYTLQSVNIDCQRCVNLFPELNALGTGKEREVAALVPTPGLRLLATLPNTPIRGLWAASNGDSFAIAANKFYKISSTWTYTELGTLSTSSGTVSMSDNGTKVFIVDGSFGYVWDTSLTTFTKITSPDFYPSTQVTFQDGYFIFIKTGTQQFFISGINDVTFDPLDVGSAEGSPDNLVGLICFNQNLFLFGSKSIEVFYNSGDADFPFARIQGAGLSATGCSAPFSIAKAIDTIYWIGGDDTGTGIVYRMQGYQPQRISTPAIESVIRGLTSTQLAAATSYTYQQGGHIFYCLNLPGTYSTWVFDSSTQFWHERTYLNLWSLERHRAENHALINGLNVVGDYQTGSLYALDQSTYTDNGISIARIRSSPHFSQNLKLIRHNGFQLDMETGVGTTGTGQGINPQAVLRWSDDGGHSWSNEHWSDIGKIGNTKTRVNWRRLGMARDRVYEVKITDPVKVVLLGVELDVDGGSA